MRKRKILIFDDIEIFLRLERMFLHREEFQLMTARSGREVLKLARETLPDVIILDFFLPDMGGDECCLNLKGDVRLHSIPVIMVVNGGRESDLDRCRRAECDAIVTRPINRAAFLDTVRKFLRIKERFSPRHSSRMLVHYGTTPRQLRSGYSVNLGTGGLFIETDHLFAIDTLLTVEIIVPHNGKRIRCNASVAWINQPEHIHNHGLPAGMGLRFLDLDSGDREFIHEYILQGGPGSAKNPLAENTAAAKGEEKPAKILIIDDNPGNRKRLRSILGQEEYGILEAAGSEEAFELAREEHPDLVIIDAALQGDGNDLCEKLRKINPSSDIPVILLSGWTFSLGNSRVLEAGATDYISRPFSERDILAKVRNCLSIHQLSESLSRTRRQLLAEDREREESMRSAAIIQQCLLPITTPKVVSFDFAWRFMPCEEVGGDLFNIFKLDETHVGAYIMDVSGQGVPAAMMATSVAQSLNPANSPFMKTITNSPPYYELVSPSEVLAKLNREYPIERFEKHFTICYLLLNVQTGEIRYSNAAHPSPLLVRADGRVEKLNAGGTIIGIGDGVTYEEGKTRMENGDRLFLYTDGIIEHSGWQGELYGEERLICELQTAEGETLQMTCACIINSLTDFGDGQKPDDDITLVGIECREPVGPGSHLPKFDDSPHHSS